MPVSTTIGSVTVLALEDGVGPFFEPREIAFPEADAQLWAEADRRDPGSVRDGGWQLRFRCFALRFDDGRIILVDAGIGPASAPSAWAPLPGRLPEELAAAGIDRHDVDTVVLTHVHTDHIGWSMDAERAPYFPNAEYLVQAAEIAAVERREPTLARWLFEPLRAANQLAVADGTHRLAPAAVVRPTPGHTPGHQSVLLGGGEPTLVVTGDLLVHVVQLIDPDQPYRYDDDPALARESRLSLLKSAGGLVLATAHLSEPFIPVAGSDGGTMPTCVTGVAR
ncbi:glyoxylase-like metal-dependent hydrolase (beta-lactamase superfamily II) [Catenulispora sp. GAS73]|uniref:MBL fold metallo-hydrolase n=1 Tax=Catenulispora sp. GAS73 TaxID=3156269 RepID=UPI003513F11C